ncbi:MULTISPECIES: helix-turn-helix transcriptional regulator [unclassified Bradyrhizobium]|nr:MULTISPECIES: helix-turn-helix transcriptional regulator [unclassified Bradyrhizobium]
MPDGRWKMRMSTRGTRIKEALDARRIRKQHALARALNVHESAITRWKEDGNMSLQNAIALCEELDISADWLLLGRGTMDQHRTQFAIQSTNYELFQEAYGYLKPDSQLLLTSFIKSVVESAR